MAHPLALGTTAYKESLTAVQRVVSGAGMNGEITPSSSGMPCQKRPSRDPVDTFLEARGYGRPAFQWVRMAVVTAGRDTPSETRVRLSGHPGNDRDGPLAG